MVVTGTHLEVTNTQVRQEQKAFIKESCKSDTIVLLGDFNTQLSDSDLNQVSK